MEILVGLTALQIGVNMLPLKKEYNTDIFKFKEFIQEVFNIEKIDTIDSDIPLIERTNDQSTKHHKLFYKAMTGKTFSSLYTKFIQEHVCPLYSDSIVVQKFPTFRIAYPDNIAVGEYHKDRYYRDRQWASIVKELNLFLPFTNAFDTNTIWVESEEDKKDFAPMNCNYGEFIQWNGSDLLHGNKINDTGKTRISIDFRVIEHKNYQPSEHGSINLNKKFKIGEYYDLY